MVLNGSVNLTPSTQDSSLLKTPGHDSKVPLAGISIARHVNSKLNMLLFCQDDSILS